MQVVIERCAGLDVHQETVVACRLVGAPGVRPTKEVRTVATMTRDLVALRGWLAEAGVTHAVIECGSARGPDADRHRKMLISLT